METLKSWAVSIVAAAAVTAILSYLSPKGVMDKSIKVIVGLFMLICFISPFINSNQSENFAYDIEQISEWLSDSKAKKDVEDKVVSMLEVSVSSRISAYLKNAGIDKSEIDVKVNADESNNIKIKKIDIKLFKKIDPEDLKNFVETEYEITPIITYASEE